jgi:hypothetical protein
MIALIGLSAAESTIPTTTSEPADTSLRQQVIVQCLRNDATAQSKDHVMAIAKEPLEILFAR